MTAKQHELHAERIALIQEKQAIDNRIKQISIELIHARTERYNHMVPIDQITLPDITIFLQFICDQMRFNYDDLFKKSRERYVIEARHTCTYMLNRYGYHRPYIKQLFNQNHATIIHAIKSTLTLADAYSSFKQALSKLDEAISQEFNIKAVR